MIDGLVRNAIENTPDEGRIEIKVSQRGEGALLQVHDYGIGIPEEAQKRVFEGFVSTRDTMAYSTRKPFDFMAGGKGADLLRMKIFSERYRFTLELRSKRCDFLASEGSVGPGRISRCSRCSSVENCHKRGGTTFTLYFPPAFRQQEEVK